MYLIWLKIPNSIYMYVELFALHVHFLCFEKTAGGVITNRMLPTLHIYRHAKSWKVLLRSAAANPAKIAKS